MSYIANCKWGICSVCGGEPQNVVKIKKELFCTSCNQKAKAEEQIKKAKRRNAARQTSSKLRSIAYSEDRVREGSKMVEQGKAELKRWFRDRRKEMTGVCSNCMGKTCKDSDTEYIRSIAHILPKAYFPSVATHEKNWLELCFYKKSCHTNMDNKMLDLTEMACWDEIVTKFVAIYPSIATKERRRIPEVLLQYIEVEK